MAEKVSIFIPAYNAAPFLARSIGSVLDQTFQDFYLYILDDASTDNTLEVIRPFLADPKVTYVRHSKNLGMSGNWNKGIEFAKGTYVAKLDADDFYRPYFLEEALTTLEENPEVGLVFGGYEWITQEGIRSNEALPYTGCWIADGHVFLENLQRKFVALGPTICVRRECYERLGGFIEDMRIHSDWEMWTRIAANYSIAYINKVLASIYRHANSVTAASLGDTRTPDDFTVWLKLLDQQKLPYSLTAEQRNLLELSMIEKCRNLLNRAIGRQAWSTVEASVRFLLQRRQVPLYEKGRYRLILSLCKQRQSLIPEAMRGSRVTARLWNLEAQLQIKLPARDPYQALNLAAPHRS